jgi:hypothetical protein
VWIVFNGCKNEELLGPHFASLKSQSQSQSHGILIGRERVGIMHVSSKLLTYRAGQVGSLLVDENIDGDSMASSVLGRM